MIWDLRSTSSQTDDLVAPKYFNQGNRVISGIIRVSPVYKWSNLCTLGDLRVTVGKQRCEAGG
jgi:hypothetical protein